MVQVHYWKCDKIFQKVLQTNLTFIIYTQAQIINISSPYSKFEYTKIHEYNYIFLLTIEPQVLIHKIFIINFKNSSNIIDKSTVWKNSNVHESD